MLSFPEDIKIEILTRLPVKSLLRFRCISKSWYKLIKSPNFVKLQLNRSLKYGDHGILYDDIGKICCLDYDSSCSEVSNTALQFNYPSEFEVQRSRFAYYYPCEHRILGSCNGLVCYISPYKEDIIVWNPCTSDYRKIPTSPPPIESTGDKVYYSYAFGYDLKTDDYKFARMTNIRFKYSEISVYSLKFDLWKTYQDIPSMRPCVHLVFFEGILHWLEMAPLKIGLQTYEHPSTICTFDISNEAFKEIPLPPHFSNKLYCIRVCLLGGCLCLTGSLFNKCCEVWMMKDYDVHGSWTKMFTIGEGSGLHVGAFRLYPKQSFKNGVILVKVDSSRFYLYDLKHEKCTELEINGRVWVSTLPFLGSLVSPNNLGTFMEM